MTLSNIWFIRHAPDFEREQWTLLAYLRDAGKDLIDNRIEPFYSNIKRKIQDIECFLTTRQVVSVLTKEENELLSNLNKLPDDNPDSVEVFKIARWGLVKLQEIHKKFNNIWRQVESSFNMFYIGDKPNFKVTEGILLVRYYGSVITEVYRFWKEDGRAFINHIEYTEDDYKVIKERFDDEVFVIAESEMSFNTRVTSMPFLIDTIEKKIMN